MFVSKTVKQMLLNLTIFAHFEDRLTSFLKNLWINQKKSKVELHKSAPRKSLKTNKYFKLQGFSFELIPNFTVPKKDLFEPKMFFFAFSSSEMSLLLRILRTKFRGSVLFLKNFCW